MDKVYRKKEKLYFYDCDVNKNAKLSTINKIFAEIAGEGFGQSGMTHQWLLEHGYAFLLSKMSIAFEKIPKADDVIYVQTWERGTRGASFLRDFEIFDENENLLCSAHSEWVLVSPETHRIIKPTEFEGEQNVLAEKTASAPDCIRLKMKEGTLADERVIRYSQIDGNGHVYNAFYADFAVDALPPELREKEVRYYQINFVNEAKLDDKMQVFVNDGETLTIKGVIGEKDSFVCEIIYR